MKTLCLSGHNSHTCDEFFGSLVETNKRHHLATQQSYTFFSSVFQEFKNYY